MKAEGNDGPSSSILLPTSCRLTGTTITAEGTYANGGFVPNVYNRYGDIIVLYVLAAPSPGYAQGMQLGVSGVSESPVVGSRASWQVSLSISSSAGVPARCVVAAQPTHAGQLAPAPTPSTSTSTTTATPGEQLPISAESDSQMRAEGNDGPSSAILLPNSCRLTGTTITAAGTYSNGGLVPNVYDRYGDIIVLYVLAAPSPGYAQGTQLGASDVSDSPGGGQPRPVGREPVHFPVRWRTRPMRCSSTANSRPSTRALATGNNWRVLMAVQSPEGAVERRPEPARAARSDTGGALRMRAGSWSPDAASCSRTPLATAWPGHTAQWRS